MTKKVERIALCNKCFTIFPFKISRNIYCPSCKKRLSIKKQVELLSLITEGIYFGYIYRRKYEFFDKSNIRKGNKIRFCLPEPTILWNFIALAILSGLTYDISKCFYKKVIESIKHYLNLNEKNKDTTLFVLLNDEKQQKILSKYLKEYYSGKLKTKSSVISAINEEILIKDITKDLKLTKSLTKKRLSNKIKKAEKVLLLKQKDRTFYLKRKLSKFINL